MDGHQRAHQVAYQTARTDLLGQEAMRLLQRVKQGNAYVFYAPEDLRERIERVAEEADAG